MPNVESKNERIDYFDILRGIGIVLMVMGHVDFGAVFSKYIHTFHMPIFFFVAGFFLKPEKYKSLWEYITHEAKTLLIPYVVFVLFCQPLHYIWTGHFDFLYFVKSLLSSNHNRIDVSGVYWFLLCLFVAKVIFFILQRKFSHKVLAILCAIASILGNILPFNLPLCLDSALSSLLVIYAGFFLKRIVSRPRICSVLNLPLWTIGILFVGNALLIILNGMVNFRTNRYSCIPLFWFNCFVAILLWINISIRIDQAKGKTMMKIATMLKYVGRNSIVYVLINEHIIFLVSTAVAFVARSILPVVIERVIVLTITMILLTIANEVFNRTKLRILLGKF